MVMYQDRWKTQNFSFRWAECVGLAEGLGTHSAHLGEDQRSGWVEQGLGASV
jgi:hypothetical protein